MTDKLPEHKLKKFLFFNKPQKKGGKLIAGLKGTYFTFYYTSLAVGMVVVSCFIISVAIDSIPESDKDLREREIISTQIKLENKLNHEADIKYKIKIFDNLVAQSNKSQKEVIDFLSQQKNASSRISLNPVSENILEVNYKVNYNDYSYLVEFDKNKMKYITIKNADKLEIKNFKDKNQKFAIIEPTNQVAFKGYDESLTQHIRVELKK